MVYSICTSCADPGPDGERDPAVNFLLSLGAFGKDHFYICVRTRDDMDRDQFANALCRDLNGAELSDAWGRGWRMSADDLVSYAVGFIDTR